MGCSTSSQTSVVDTTRPCVKPEESNGSSTTANENGKVAGDCETIPDQTPAGGGDAKPADESAAAAPAGQEPQPGAASPPAEAAADSTTEPAAPEQEIAKDTATDSEAKTEEAPPPSE
ncbi:myristoylated alanine-rich C-kinase substrate isoform X2 [Etheostoma cragini]|uniref:myristoylated alanine-rich C-kinase substrate isoform X2 n=1 Tax=Etheostoma cragini TaxID=417921 RepID=UPI00155F080B|nr:myristoylated alanine-rich C-kinase substrate isoform X2 [Etheostoma cragini]